MANIANLRPPWKPGESGNPNGRPARARLTEQFVRDVSDTWSRHGSRILDDMAQKDGRDFAHLCAKLIPANVVVDLQARLPGGLDASDLAIFQAIKEAIPNANELEPAQVLQFTLDAIRAHSAPLIDNRQTTGGTTE